MPIHGKAPHQIDVCLIGRKFNNGQQLHRHWPILATVVKIPKKRNQITHGLQTQHLNSKFGWAPVPANPMHSPVLLSCFPPNQNNGQFRNAPHRPARHKVNQYPSFQKSAAKHNNKRACLNAQPLVVCCAGCLGHTSMARHPVADHIASRKITSKRVCRDGPYHRQLVIEKYCNEATSRQIPSHHSTSTCLNS